MTVVIGTAGHIDHGKTTLLRALTGIDADRLPEERSRGMTIDVGYAHLSLDDGTELDFVDVPGHDRLVGNMLVGAGEIDAALVVVAADDGPRAQTIEHLQLLDGLGIADGIAVVTKTDAVEEGRVDEVAAAVRALVDATTLRSAPVLAVSARSGRGLAELRAALIGLRERVAERTGPGRELPVRFAIDRVFSIRGRGTVVTGSLRGGDLAPGEILRVVPARPGTTIRVRELQVHGRTVERAGPGRVAINVAGGDAVPRVERGVVLTTDPSVTATDRILVSLHAVPSLPGGGLARMVPADRTRLAVHAGTAHVQGVLARSGRDGVELPDGSAIAIVRLAAPIALAPGDRIALRRPSPGEALGGGRVLDTHPPRGVARRRTTPERLAALAATAPGTDAWAAARRALHGAVADPVPGLADDVAAATGTAMLDAVRAADGDAPRRTEVVRAGVRELRRQVGRLDAESGPRRTAPGLVEARLEALVATGALVRQGDRLRLPGTAAAEPSAAELAAMDRLVELLTPVAPPSLSDAARAAGCDATGVRALERANRIVRLDDDLAWAFATYRDLAGRALAMAGVAPLTPAAYRDATGTSRKYVMAILEDLDRRAILRRTPEGHVPGPRAPQAATATGTGST
ncbi:MAG TPA: selenocysteine-specific translation elongation factor [Candidatus Limnocylindrales bacterium]